MNEFAIRHEKLRNLAQLGAYVVLATGLVVFVAGWGFDLATLRNVVPGTFEVKPGTTFGLALAGMAILILVDPTASVWQTRAGKVLAFVVALTGLAFLGEFVLGWNLGIDEIPFRDTTGRAEGVEFPGRLAPATAVNLVLVGVALLTLDVHLKGKWRLGEVLCLPVLLISAMTMVAYMYEIPSFYEPDPSTKMALTTSVGFIILAFSIVFMRPQGHLATVLSADAPGSVIARRLIPVLIVLPLLLGWARLEAAEAGLVSDKVATWWFTATTVAIFLLVLTRTASKLNEVNDDRREIQRKFNDQANDESSSPVPGDSHDVMRIRNGGLYEPSASSRLQGKMKTLGNRLVTSRRLPYAASIAAGVSFGVVVWDRLDSLGPAAEALAGLLLIAAVAVFLYFFRSVSRSRRHLERYERMRIQSAEASVDSLVTIDTEGTILEWNTASAQIFGYPGNEAVGRNLGEFIWPSGRQEGQGTAVAALTGGGAEPVLDQAMELTAVSERGRTFPIEMTLSQIQAEPVRFVAYIRDISERRSLDEENEHLAAIVRSSEDAIYSKDLDGVVTAWNKGAEEIFGFTADEAIGENILNLTVPADRIVEDHSITNQVLSGGSAEVVTQRQTRSGKILDVSLHSFPIRDSNGEIVGVSISAHDITEHLLLKEQEAQDAERALWVGRIRDALINDGFVLFGQPVIHVRNGNIHHHELLIRMNLDGEIISPDKFLPHAEASDLILEIDHWAIRRGIEYGAICPVAINLSARSLSVPGLSDYIAQALSDFGTDPANVQFEVTETAAAENLDDARSLIGQLTDLGCGSSLDDFGTGYGTFTYLKYLPVTELKIDVSFIRDLSDETDSRVVKSIIEVARSFDMATVAEGVENEETLRLLDRMQVDLAQGYHIGRPASMDQVIKNSMAKTEIDCPE